jgi:O-antigen/teichoic acid export membrane protein
MAIIAPVTVLFVASGDWLTAAILGEKWLPMVSVLQFAAVAAVIRALVATGQPLFLALNHPRTVFYIQMTKALTLVIFIYPLARGFGTTGAAVALLFNSIAMVCVWLPSIRYHCGISLRIVWLSCFPLFLAVITMGSILYGGRIYYSNTLQLETVHLMILILLALSSYFFGLWICYRNKLHRARHKPCSL